MKKNILISLTIIILLSACQNSKKEKNDVASDTEKNTNYNDNKKELDSIKTEIEYQPEKYEETIQDTLLNFNTNLKLELKRYTLMNKGFNVEYNYDNFSKTIHFRDFATDITLTLENKILFKETINKEDFANLIEDEKFLSHAFLSLADFIEYNDETEQIKIKCMTAMIESDYAYIFQLTFDKKGNKSVKLIEIT